MQYPVVLCERLPVAHECVNAGIVAKFRGNQVSVSGSVAMVVTP
jgi:hypothetical protein